MQFIKLVIAIAILILSPALAFAESYRVNGLYEISAPEDWRIVSGSHTAELMRQAGEITKRITIKPVVDIKDISTPFMIYKQKNNEAFLIRVMVSPPELTKEEFDRFTVLDINNIGEELSKRQNEVMRASGIRLVSSQFGTGTFKGVPAIRTESISYNSKGFKVSRAQYIVYRTSATLIVSLEHTVLSGEPNYKLIENQISKFNVLVQ